MMEKQKRVVIKIWGEGDDDYMIPLNGDADTTSPDEILAVEWDDNPLCSAGDGYGWVAYVMPCVIDDDRAVYIPANWGVYPVVARGEGY